MDGRARLSMLGAGDANASFSFYGSFIYVLIVLSIRYHAIHALLGVLDGIYLT